MALTNSRAQANLAIDKFGELLRVERLRDKKEAELSALLRGISPEDMAWYLSETELMRSSDQEMRDKNNLPAGS